MKPCRRDGCHAAATRQAIVYLKISNGRSRWRVGTCEAHFHRFHGRDLSASQFRNAFAVLR